MKKNELMDKAFTHDLKLNLLLLVDDLNSLHFDEKDCDFYADGGILFLPLEFSEHNRKILEKYIKDFDAYQELLKWEFDFKVPGKTDAISIIQFINECTGDLILYSREKKEFYYR